MICPCKECKARFVGCHSVCDDYKLWKKSKEDLLKTVYEEKSGEPIWNTKFYKEVLKKRRKR